MDRSGDPRGGQPRHRRPHQGQPLDAHRLRRSGLQRPRYHVAAPAVDGLGRRQAARPNRARPAALRRRAAPARRAPTTSSTTPPTSAVGQPVHRRVRPELTRIPRQEPGAARRHARSPGWKTAAACWKRWTSCAATAIGQRGPRRPLSQAFELLTEQGRWRRAFDIAAEPAMRPRPLRPAHLRPERPAGAPAGRGGRRRSSRSTACPGTITAPPPSAQDRGGRQAAYPAARPGDRGADRRPDRARAVRVDAGGGDGRVRPDAADEPGRRPRPLGRTSSAC